MLPARVASQQLLAGPDRDARGDSIRCREELETFTLEKDQALSWPIPPILPDKPWSWSVDLSQDARAQLNYAL